MNLDSCLFLWHIMGYTTNEEPALLLVVIPVAPTGKKKRSLLMLLLCSLLQFLRGECSNIYCTHWFQISELNWYAMWKLSCEKY